MSKIIGNEKSPRLMMVCGLPPAGLLPGNAKKGSAISMPDEFEIPMGAMLVMDRGYNDKGFLSAAREKGLEYFVAVKRDSTVYGHSRIDEGEWRPVREPH